MKITSPASVLGQIVLVYSDPPTLTQQRPGVLPGRTESQKENIPQGTLRSLLLFVLLPVGEQ